MKKIVLAFLLLLIVGCSVEGPNAKTNSGMNNGHRAVCIDGVAYIKESSSLGGYLGYGYMSVKFNRDGSVATCDS